LTTPVRNLEFDTAALEDLAWWIQQDRKKALRIIRLVQETASDPFGGIGKPEPLKHELAGCWSKRIDDEHRLVYQVRADMIRILACRYHY
jgi:toxin YoeB